MIGLNFVSFVFLYLVLFAGLVCAFWFLSAARERRFKRLSAHKNPRCSSCGMVFIAEKDPEPGSFLKCPRCGSGVLPGESNCLVA